MTVIFTARMRVRDWRALLWLSDETLLLYARAAGARRYQLCRDTHDAAEALLLVEAGSVDALRPLCDALRRRTSAVRGQALADEGARAVVLRHWEAAGCRAIAAATSMEP
jgi:hypothetical protein